MNGTMRVNVKIFRSYSFYVVFTLFLALVFIHFIWPIYAESILSLTNFLVFSLRLVSMVCIYFWHYRFLLPLCFDSKGWMNYLIGLVFSFLFFIAIALSFTHSFFVNTLSPLEPRSEVLGKMISSPMLTAFIYAITFWLSYLVFTIKRKEEKLNAEVSQEVHFLRNQINPHFVFNSLNNIYSLAISKSDKTPESILKLSEVLRYVFYETEKEKIPLESEIKYLQNYIAFQQYRLPIGSKVNFEKIGEFDRADIVPMILINSVENAFKYGVSTFTNTQIDITVSFENSWLSLKTVNSIFAVAGHKSSKIGGENTLKRLEFHYPNAFSYEGKEEDGKYYTELKIKLV